MSINYDFIVVGGGSSGAALTSILSTKGPTLLIERGANYTAFPQTFTNRGWPQAATTTIEFFKHEGSGHWSGTPNILGGGSSLNAGACWRGQRKLFDDLGLDIDSVEQSFQRLEETVCHGVEDSEYSRIFTDSWSEAGFIQPDLENVDGYASWIEDEIGQHDNDTVQRARSLFDKDGKRSRASDLFENDLLGLVSSNGFSLLDQGNLTVHILSTVKRVLFNDKNEAIGVEVHGPFGDYSALVRNGGKVFLNAGVFETPKLLMLSGIGPSETLDNYNIPIVHENDAVGKNFVDRKEVTFTLPSFKSNQGDEVTILTPAAIQEDFWSSVVHRNAFESGNVMMGCVTCAPTNRTEKCQQHLLNALVLYGIDTRPPVVQYPYYIAQRQPKTRGYVSLASSDYNVPPIVHDGWALTYEDLSPNARSDLNSFTDAVRDLAVNILQDTLLMERLGYPITSNNTGAFSPQIVSTYDVLGQIITSNQNDLSGKCSFSPQFLSLKNDSDRCSSWDDCVPTIPPIPTQRNLTNKFILDTFTSSYHGSGTCKVGDVVEKSTLQVKGVNGLYIADLSVLDTPVDIHPMMTAMAIGMVIGESVEPIQTDMYEKLPIVLSFICIVIVISLIAWVIRTLMSMTKHQNEESKNAYESKTEHTLESFWNESPAPASIEIQSDQTNSSSQHSSDRISANSKGHESHSSLMMWKDVSCSYHEKNNDGVQTLFDNFGELRAGELTAVMGPSGSSKSTLLDILSGRKSLGTVTGNFFVLGKEFVGSEITKNLGETIQDVSAYIPQEEFFYPTQTVEEAVAFSANMKLGREDPTHRKDFISTCLKIVGLDPKTYAFRKIGGTLPGGLTIRGLSGGEKKRLALAIAIAMKPSLIFIDELTSGLDSENAELVVKLLKHLCKTHNVAAMLIIHQPSPEVFSLFDRLILLSKGKCLFSDSCENLGTFYERNYDEGIPTTSNIAEDLLAKASVYDDSTFQGRLPFSGKELFDGPQEMVTSDSSQFHHTPPSSIFKLFTVFQRNLLNHYVRNIANIAVRLSCYSLLSIVIGLIFWKVAEPSTDRGLTFEEAELVVRMHTFILNVSYLLPFATIPLFVGDKRFFAAESALGLYSPWMYCVAEVFLEFAVVTMASILEACILIPMCAVWNPVIPQWVSFLTILCVLIFSGLVGSTIILCCSIALPNQDVAFTIGSTIATVSLALSGGFLPFNEMPNLPYWMQWASPVKYSFQALINATLRGTSAEKLIDIAEYNTPPTISENIGVLFVIFFVFSTITSFSLARVKEHR